MLYSKDLEFIMEAHNGLSARIVEEAGTLQMSTKQCVKAALGL